MWFVFLLMSIVFCFGWALGSGLGYQNGRADAEALFDLQQQLLAEVEEHLDTTAPLHLDPTGPLPAGAGV